MTCEMLELAVMVIYSRRQRHPGSCAPTAQRAMPQVLATLDSSRSRVTVEERLRAVARIMQVPYEQVVWHALRAHHVEWIRQALTERGVAPSTVNVTLSALKGIARRARNLNLMTSEEYDRVRDVRGAKGERQPAGRSATAGEIEALVRACLRDRTPAGVRDVAMLGVLYIGGIRRAELAGLQLSDYTSNPPTLKVRGKGNKHRAVPLTGAAAAAVDDWLKIRGDFPGALFVPLSQRGEIAGPSMTGRAISKMLLKRVGQAGVEHLSPHDMRRTFVVMCTNCGYENVVDRREVEARLGRRVGAAAGGEDPGRG